MITIPWFPLFNTYTTTTFETKKGQKVIQQQTNEKDENQRKFKTKVLYQIIEPKAKTLTANKVHSFNVVGTTKNKNCTKLE